MSFTEIFEDPDMIREMITAIQNIANFPKYQEIKRIDKLQFEFAMRDEFPTFSEDHPFLFRKIAMGDDLTFLYKMLDGISKINDGSLSVKEVEQGIGYDLANAYVYPALNDAANGNVKVDSEPKKKPAFSLTLDQFTNPDILNS
jgi:hypothetical protein